MRARGSRARRRRERARVTTGGRADDDGRDDGSDDARTRLAARDRVARARPLATLLPRRELGKSAYLDAPAQTQTVSFSLRSLPRGMPSRTPRRADFDAMSLKVASTLAPRLAEHARRVSGDGRAAGWLVGPASTPGEIVILGSICRARACSDAGADPPRGAALLPGGLAVVGAYVSGDKAAAEALVAEVKPHLDGGFALASIAADGAASFYHRFLHQRRRRRARGDRARTRMARARVRPLPMRYARSHRYR